MRHRRPHVRIRAWGAQVFAVLMWATVASAQLDVELAGVSGVFRYANLSGDIYIPHTSGEQDAKLLIYGVQALGYREWFGRPATRTASEFHFSLSSIAWPDTVEWLRGELYMPEETGYFEATIELHELSDPAGPVRWREGGSFFRLQVGRPAASFQDFWWDSVLPWAQIYSAHLVSSAVVPTEQTSWGSVKCLFR